MPACRSTDSCASRATRRPRLPCSICTLATRTSGKTFVIYVFPRSGPDEIRSQARAVLATLEVLPQVWLFDDNDNFGGRNLETDPIFGLEAHVTRDFTETFWGSLDVAGFTGGKSSIQGTAGSSIDNLGVGLTLGFQVSDNLQISTSYFATVDDSDPGDLRGDEFRIMFTFGWHPLIEGMRRLAGEH